MQGATDVKRIAIENHIMEPYYIIIIGSAEDYSQAFLVIDCEVIGEIHDIYIYIMDFTDYLTVNTIQYDTINTRGMNS